jgi:hypothetical protein
MMNNNAINIGRKDVLWNYAATFQQIGVGVILLPYYFTGIPAGNGGDLEGIFESKNNSLIY